MKWSDYEKEIHEYFLQIYPSAKITFNAKILGRYSKTLRQIDVLIEDDVTEFPFRIVVDAKFFSRKVDVKCVEACLSMCRDVEANQGLIVTQKGYSKAAINRAHFDPDKLDLDVLNFNELLENQGLGGIPYAGNTSILLSAPFGWVIDSSSNPEFLACLYQRGLTFEDAMKSLEWMYVNFWHKDQKVNSIAGLINYQNEQMRKDHPSVNLTEERAPKREDRKEVYIRKATWTYFPCREITGFLDCGEFIVFFVLFTPEELESRNIRKLSHVLRHSIPAKIKFNNIKKIDHLVSKCTTYKEKNKEADAYCQIADWYGEMDMHGKAMDYRRKCWNAFPEIHQNIKPLIRGELILSNFDSAINYSVKYFSLAPNNPTVMRDLLLIFEDPKYRCYFEIVIDKISELNRGNIEALGNLRFHYGHYLADLNENSLANEQFIIAKTHFQMIDDKHEALSALDILLKEIK